MQACMQPDGYTANPGDCDDATASVHPTADEICADEICNLADEDCDTRIDEDVSPAPETPEHCGACGLACPAGYECNGSICEDAAEEVAAGQGFVAVRGRSGSIYVWGTRDEWTSTIATVPGIVDATSVSAAEDTGCAVERSGLVKCWGDEFISDTPLPGTTTIAGLSSIVRVSVGGAHACAVDTGGGVRCWGQNAAGQLGTGDAAARPAPTLVSGLPGAVSDVATGYSHTCARVVGGEVYCWGYGEFGQLGQGAAVSSLTPVRTNLTGALELSGGGMTTCSGVAGGVRCWGGRTTDGEVGQPLPTHTPTAVPGYPSATALRTQSVLSIGRGRHLGSGLPCTVYDGHTCSISAARRLYCWGANFNGQLGDGTTTTRSTAGIVPSIPGNITSVATGYDLGAAFSCTEHPSGFSCATNDAGAVYCWGDNRGGLLRTGDTIDRLMPEAVVGFPVRTVPTARP